MISETKTWDFDDFSGRAGLAARFSCHLVIFFLNMIWGFLGGVCGDVSLAAICGIFGAVVCHDGFAVSTG